MEEQIKSGSVEIYLKDNRCLDRVVVHASEEPFGVLLTLNAVDTHAMYQVCEHVFGVWDERPPFAPPKQLWEGSSFFHLAPLHDRPDLFWFSVGALNTYVPTERMKAVFDDLKNALSLAGINPNR